MTKTKKIIRNFIIFTIILSILYSIAVFSNIPFIKKWRTIYIETAMTTMNHQWLATAFIPPSVVNEVVLNSKEQNNIQKELISTWKEEIPATVDKDEIYFKQDTNNSLPNNDTIIIDKEEKIEKENENNDFYKLFWELDKNNFEEYIKNNPEIISNGYENIYIDNLSLEKELFTIFKEPIRLIDSKNGILIIQVSGEGYQGNLAKIKDPSKVYVAKASNLGSHGDLILKFAKNNDSLITMNASGFLDENWKGNGGTVSGSLILDGIEYGNPLENQKFFGFKQDNRLYIENYDTAVIENYRWAVQFNPALIVDGEVFVQGSFGWGLQPRSAIGQSKIGEVLMLVVDGRQVHSLGCTVGDLSEIMLRHNAYQAMNLDGGSSSIMAYKDKVITKPSSKTIDGRYLPSAFIVK